MSPRAAPPAWSAWRSLLGRADDGAGESFRARVTSPGRYVPTGKGIGYRASAARRHPRLRTGHRLRPSHALEPTSVLRTSLKADGDQAQDG